MSWVGSVSAECYVLRGRNEGKTSIEKRHKEKITLWSWYWLIHTTWCFLPEFDRRWFFLILSWGEKKKVKRGGDANDGEEIHEGYEELIVNKSNLNSLWVHFSRLGWEERQDCDRSPFSITSITWLFLLSLFPLTSSTTALNIIVLMTDWHRLLLLRIIHETLSPVPLVM